MSKYLEMRDSIKDKITEFKQIKPDLEKKYKENERLSEKAMDNANNEQLVLVKRKAMLDVVVNFKNYIFEKIKKHAKFGVLAFLILFAGFEGFSVLAECDLSLITLYKSLLFSLVGGSLSFGITAFIDSIDLLNIKNSFNKELLESLIKSSEEKIKDFRSVADFYKKLSYKNLQAIDSINECIWTADKFIEFYEAQDVIARAICRNDIEAVNECFEAEPKNDEAYKLLRKSNFR